MIRFGKKAAMLTAAGVLSAMTVTGCSGSINTDAVVATVGEENITLGVANFYARMLQGQYETYYASMMGTTGEKMWTQDAGEDQTYEESVKDGLMENLQNMYLISQHAADYEVSLTDDEKEAEEEVRRFLSECSANGLRKISIITGKGLHSEDGVGVLRSTVQTVLDESGLVSEKANAPISAGGSGALWIILTASDLTFDSESTSPNEDLIAAVDAFETEGETTDVIEADNGLYVGQLTSLLDREATDQEKASIVEQRRQDQYDSLLEEWRNGTDISVKEKVWNKVDFEDTGVTIITSETDDTSSDTGSTDDGSTDSGTSEGNTADGGEAAEDTGADSGAAE